jgi:hypothetical protein
MSWIHLSKVKMLIFLLHYKITAFVKKLSIRKKKRCKWKHWYVSTTNYFIEDNELGLAVIKNIILSHLTTLVTQFEKY